MKSSNRWIDNVLYQPIVDVERSVVGFECLARVIGVGSLDDFIAELEPRFLDNVLIDMVESVSRHVVSPSFGQMLAGKRLFINCEKYNIANPKLIDLLIEFSCFLDKYSVKLVAEITERDLQPSRPYRAYLEGVKRLSLAKVPVALDDFLLEESDRTELESGLCQIVKIEVDALPLDYQYLRGQAECDYLFDLVGSLDRFACQYGVELLLERVEDAYCFETISALPFKFFQGYQFGRPEPLYLNYLIWRESDSRQRIA